MIGGRTGFDGDMSGLWLHAELIARKNNQTTVNANSDYALAA
jgi:hypothetical protein